MLMSKLRIVNELTKCDVNKILIAFQPSWFTIFLNVKMHFIRNFNFICNNVWYKGNCFYLGLFSLMSCMHPHSKFYDKHFSVHPVLYQNLFDDIGLYNVWVNIPHYGIMKHYIPWHSLKCWVPSIILCALEIV